MSYRLAVDIGGTFTDVAMFDATTGTMSIHKLLTTPGDPEKAVLDGVAALLEQAGVAVGAVEALVHGTTLVTNAVIERKGSRIAFITTKGFRDLLDIGQENRYDQFDMRLKYPKPLAGRDLQFEVDERVGPAGEVRRPLDDAEVRRVLAEARARGAEAIAVCLLHSYVEPAHEARIAAIARAEFPDIPVSVSSEVVPFMREFERWTTTTMNAYTQAMVDRYLAGLEGGLERVGFGGRFYIMASNGGTVTPETARQFPVRLLESGPAAGVLMSSYLSRLLGTPNVLSFDMGGTTAKGALVIGHEVQKAYELEVAHVHEHKAGSGFTVKIPVIDMVEIGAGGGSIAGIDDRGLIRVGPRSAGAVPGPACYGRGGADPTVTDANVVLGLLDPDFFLGGRMRLDVEAAGRVLMDRLAKPLGVDVRRAAWGVHQTVNEYMAQAFRLHASERGRDYRSFAMTAFGGSGPLHAARIARILRIPTVVFPVGAGVMSAFGLLVSPLSFETVLSRPMPLEGLDDAMLAHAFAGPRAEAEAFLTRSGIAARDIRFRRRLDMRFRGQGYEIEVALPDPDGTETGVDALPGLFADEYERIFATRRLTGPLEIINLKLEAVGPPPSMQDGFRLDRGAGGAALKGRRRVYDPGFDDYVDCPVYDRYALRPGDHVAGPALIEELESTCVIGEGDHVVVDDRLNLVCKIGVGGRN